MELDSMVAGSSAFNFGALRIEIDADPPTKGGEDDEEEEHCVLSPLAHPFSPRPKKKEKKDRAGPRRRRRKRAQVDGGTASVASSGSDSPGSQDDKVQAAGPPRPAPLSPSRPACHASPADSPLTCSPPTRQPASVPAPPPPLPRPRTPPKAVEAVTKSPCLTSTISTTPSKQPAHKFTGPGSKAARKGVSVGFVDASSTPGRCKPPSSSTTSYLRSFFPAVSFEQEALPPPITDDDWNALEQAERQRWQEWAIFAAEQERARRMMELRMIEEEEARERRERREWAKRAIEEEQRKRVQDQFIQNMTNTQWFADTISSFCEKYEVVCPYSYLGCRHICLRHELEEHLRSCCKFGTEKAQPPRVEDTSQYEVVCPNAILGCQHSCPREEVAEHLQKCHFRGPTRGEEQEERNHWKRIVIEETEEERARRVADGYKEFTMSEKRGSLQRLLEGQIHGAVSALHREVVEFSAICSRVEAQHRPAREAVVSHLKAAVSRLWPNATAEAYGSHATGLMSIGSDLDVVVCGCSEAGADKDPLQRLAAHLRGESWIEITKVLDHARVPLIKLVARLDSYDAEVRVDLSMEGPSHTGLATASLVSTLASRLPPLVPLTLMLKHLLRSRGLADPYTGGVPSYGLTLMVTFLLLRSRHACHSAVKPTAAEASDCHAPSSSASSTPAPPVPPQAQPPSGATPPRPPSRSCSQPHLGGAMGGAAKASGTGSAGKAGGGQATAGSSGVSPPRRGSAAAVLIRSSAAREAEALLHGTSADATGDGFHHTHQLPPPPVPPPQQRWSGAYAAEQQRRFGVRVAESLLGQVTWPAGEPEAPVLGQLLMDFFHLFGEDFEHGAEGLSVRAGGFRFPCKGHPPHPLASDPVVIEDPINIMNNVARSCYRIQAVQRAFAESLSNLRALVVRYNESATGRGGLLMSPRAAAAAASESSLARESILFHICHIDLYEFEGGRGQQGGAGEGDGEGVAVRVV